ncbi:sce7726 family protein [Sphingopyxis terrae]|uniref:sce7726 family protein n=1 Tax=Sphingopyxis terrae TaxID=33052 RepID=UPI002A0DA506|nr:sce7726 family protein [Sphingopyxis terrae]MDX8358569.1 sce7726 family protein [Sphingopyxis terrae]
MRSDPPEKAAKASLLNHLRSIGALKNASVISELVLNRWAHRADLVTVNGEIVAYEIKTASDRLTRLPRQIEAYSTVFDHVNAVVATKHLAAATEIIPDYVGLFEITNQNFVRPIRESRHSPKLSRNASMTLLPAKALAGLVRVHLGVRPATTRLEMEKQAATISDDHIRDHIRFYLKQKHASTTRSLSNLARGRKIRSTDIEDLRLLKPKGVVVTSDARDSLTPSFSDWVNQMTLDQAFGPVPNDIRALLSGSS